MSPKELYRLLDNHAVAYETVDWFEGVRIIRFEVEEDSGLGLLPLEGASDEQVIAYADSQGYQLTPEDVQEIRRGGLLVNRSGETVSQAVDDFLDAFER